MSLPSCALPAQAYNLELLHEEGRPGPESHGWCFGLPPGISAEQWPLDPLTGYPLVHGLTLRLPPDYRCHGPDVTGLSFFGCCNEHSEGGTSPDETIHATMTGAAAPADPRYLPFWTAVQNSHPRLHRMIDILDDNYAVILLTESELNGPLCRPPDTAAARALSCHAAPKWLEIGGARAFFDELIGSTDPRKHYLPKVLGGAPDSKLAWSRGLRWRPRAVDPNAGKAPQDPFTGDKAAGYQQPYYYEGENYLDQAWTKDHAPNHIGGTMRPTQATPRFSPFYLEFAEYLGGYNFGTGNCQLDFLNMKLDWACG
ncbi:MULTISPECIES: hypothetical protein [Bradyrhizobium]|uniref:Uncharacterized protein n=1 Tax=Bradyrhizobium arachidis TaxID=858423 RepID=A0AAE7THX4_9BRAD|nr:MULTISPECIES: hypothetical protein [Bradyrhizobium]QOG22523.1 hypothetical protein FOM02_39835 [Bradyrhizobium sp. SEMIA]QOZ69832.1 hypothetical protein WN72_28595 [Bradyrhizobium arachidis]UFW45940.1 hypothetical protein BaraCB756_26905 [Bradyrhizobium arachidis]SFV19325.1 hypothetical protein SAMN05192541_1491 [Bradyrhizobium arachidis]